MTSPFTTLALMVILTRNKITQISNILNEWFHSGITENIQGEIELVKDWTKPKFELIHHFIEDYFYISVGTAKLCRKG